MLRIIRLWLVFAVFLALVPLHDIHAQDASPATAEAVDAFASDTISAGGDIPRDADIGERIRDIFAEFGSLKAVIVSVKSGVVTLRGNVPDQLAIEQESSTIRSTISSATLKGSPTTRYASKESGPDFGILKECQRVFLTLRLQC